MADTYDLGSAVDPHRLAARAKGNFPTTPEAGHDHAVSVRRVEYQGHAIRIETTYRITIDGEPVGGHILVGNDGRVHYHSIPNQEFASAVDMVKRVIDLTPPGSVDPGLDLAGHGHDHDHDHHH